MPSRSIMATSSKSPRSECEGPPYSFLEAAASLWRGRRNAILAVLTIAAGLFVLGFFLIVQSNLQRLVARWSEAAELSVYLATTSRKSSCRASASRSTAAGWPRHATTCRKPMRRSGSGRFPDLAGTADRLDRNPFPASFEVRLKPEARISEVAVDRLAETLSKVPRRRRRAL